MQVAYASSGFSDWESVRSLIRRAYAPVDGVIDPPSSTHGITAESLAAKAEGETVLLAHSGLRLVGCVFLQDRGDHLYLGRYAVDPDHHGQGIGRALMEAAFAHARAQGHSTIELQARIELVQNHAIFRRFGFEEIGRTAHEGYQRATSITFRKRL